MTKTKKCEAIIGHDRPHQKKDHNQGLFLEKSGSETFKGWNPWSTIASQEWLVGKSSPLSSDMTLLRTIRRSYSLVGATVPTTHDPSVHDQIPTPTVYSHERRLTPSTQAKPSHRWSTSPSMAREMPLCEEKSNDSEMHIRGWPTLQKIWPNSKGSIGTRDGTSTTPSEHWLMPMPIDDSSPGFSMTPPYPPIFPLLYSTQASPTSPMGGNTAHTMSTPIANGACAQDTPQRGVPKSHNVSFAMAPHISKCTAATLINAVERDKSVACPMTIPMLLTPPARQTLGPLDNKKDINKGVMSQEMS